MDVDLGLALPEGGGTGAALGHNHGVGILNMNLELPEPGASMEEVRQRVDGQDQGGIFPGKVGIIFPGSIEISQEILIKNHALCCIFQKKLCIHVFGSMIICSNDNEYIPATEKQFMSQERILLRVL
jgi:hypothetical protein